MQNQIGFRQFRPGKERLNVEVDAVFSGDRVERRAPDSHDGSLGLCGVKGQGGQGQILVDDVLVLVDVDLGRVASHFDRLGVCLDCEIMLAG